jgi:hypothetical protein
MSLVEFNPVPAQQLPIFLLKSASAMMLFLRLQVLQHCIELAHADRKSPISALPEKTAIARSNNLNPFRRRFLYLLNHLSLGKSSRKGCDDMNVIGHTTVYAQGLGTQIAADRCKVRVHARAYRDVNPRFTILGAKDDVKNNFTEGLGHEAHDGPKSDRNESRFQRWRRWVNLAPGALPQAIMVLRLWRWALDAAMPPPTTSAWR